MTKGLIIGKFAPLHRGHQYVIETALEEMHEVLVVVYDAPEVTDIPLNVRAGWIKRLYPEVDVIEGWNAPNDVGYTDEVKQIQEDYIIKTLGIDDITHFYSSETYGIHMSMALGAVDRRVDDARTKYSISGTYVRSNPYVYRDMIEPVVYRDLITKVVFMGAPSTGKTTIAQRMAELYQTQWMPEYGREYWDEHQTERRLTPVQLEEIGLGHLTLQQHFEDNANCYLFCDTNPITTYIFSQYYHGYATIALRKMAKSCNILYDLVFVCDTDIPYEDTWDRSGEGNRDEFHARTLAELHTRNIPYVLLTGSDREGQVKEVLNKFKKYKNSWRI